MGILERWKLTAEELDEIVSGNPSLRGFMFGYVSEYKLKKMWFSGNNMAPQSPFSVRTVSAFGRNRLGKS